MCPHPVCINLQIEDMNISVSPVRTFDVRKRPVSGFVAFERAAKYRLVLPHRSCDHAATFQALDSNYKVKIPLHPFLAVSV